MRRTCRTRKSDLSVPIRLAGDTRAQDRLEDDGGRQLSPKVMLPGAAAADRACTGGRARHDLRRLRQEGRDEETSLLLPSVAVHAPGCSGPPTGPPPPALLQCTPVGGRSGPAAARSRPAMLTETKKKASGARDLEFTRSAWQRERGLCDDRLLRHDDGCWRCLRQDRDCGCPVVLPPSCPPPRLPSSSCVSFSSQIAPCSFLRSFRLMRAFYPHILTHAHLTVATSCR